jgi:hypothetical protein
LKKVSDWFFAGTVAGLIGGIAHLLWNAGLLLLGIIHKTFWIAMGGLFYNQQLLRTPLAQVHGAIDAIGVSAAGGIFLAAVLKFTGMDYLYVKSVILSASSGYFLFVVIFPHTGLGKNSVIVPWVALLGFTVFNGLLPGYILKKIYAFDPEPAKKASPSNPKKHKEKYGT